MIRRAVLATTLVTFLHTGTALILAGPTPNVASAGESARKRYLNPLGVALSADGRRAYVALSGIDRLAEVDLPLGFTVRRFATGRNPREVGRDGAVLTVIDDGPGALRVSLTSVLSQRVQLAPADLAANNRAASAEIPANRLVDGMGQLRITLHHEPAWDESGSWAMTKAVFVNALQATSSRGVLGHCGAGFSGALGFAGGESQTGYRPGPWFGAGLSAGLDRGTTGVAQPAAVVWDEPFETLFVAAAGSDTVLGLGPSGLRSNLKSGTPRPPVGLVRFQLPTQSNPRRMAVSDDGKVLVVSNTLADSLTLIAVSAAGAHVVKHIPLGGPAIDTARRGEILFHSAALSFNGRFACSSCHPDGGSDGHVWLTPTEDPGFARRTKPLFGVRDTAPYGWRGDSPTLADRVHKTLGQLHKHTPKPSEVRDLVAYLESLEPPAPVRAADAESAERGRDLFEGRARCSRCHSDERLTDGQRHDVGTGGLFDTPSLRGAGRRSLLLHHGRADGPHDIFRKFNDQQKHGAAHELEPCDLDDLIAYLKTL